ncbi:hypothetical protein BDQ12DRAFT_561752, partial [Crucibulum laeve]
NESEAETECYRKAWRLDRSCFATHFSLDDNAHILDRIRTQLLEGHRAERKIRAEMDHLNVYSPGSFFKPHKDTPRSQDSFGTLVIVFPSAHTGGLFTLTHPTLSSARDSDNPEDSDVWTFDSSTVLSSQPTPSFAYLAFHSDVTHSLARVTSGHRLTITYSLHFDHHHPSYTLPASAAYEEELLLAVKSILRDHRIMPNGGVLGFGLRYAYIVQPGKTPLEETFRSLKGSDAVLKRACVEVGLEAELR